MPDQLANFAYSTVAAAPVPASSGTSLDVTAGQGTRFPAVPFNAVVWPANQLPLSTNAEIVRVTLVSTDTLTIARTQESTLARTIQVGDQIAVNITKKMLDDRTSPFFTVGALDSQFITDGVDDDVQIQQAIDAASATGGGIVFIKKGTYSISAVVTIPSNITIDGDGNSTLIKAKNAYAGTSNMFANSDAVSGNTNITIKNVKFDGNQANRTGTPAEDTGINVLLKNVSYSCVTNVTFTNAFSAGLELGAGSHHNLVDKCSFTNSHWHNLLLLGDTNGPIETYDNTISNCNMDVSGINYTEGVNIELAKHCVRNTITGCKSTNAREGGINLFYRCNNNVVIGNVFNNNDQNGVAFVDESDYNLVANNMISESGACGISSTTAFLARGGYYNTLSNNIITDCAQNGIRGSHVGALIEGNTIFNCGWGGASTFKYGVYIIVVSEMRFINNKISSSADRGANFQDISNSIIKGNYFGYNTAQGVLMDSAGIGFIDSVMEGNIFESNGGVGLVLFKLALRSTISNNIARNNTGVGIDIRGASYCTISNNSCSGNTTFGFDIKADAASIGTRHCIFSGNSVTGNTSGGIRENTGSDYNIYAFNNLSGNVTANLALVGTNNEVGGNILSID